MKLRTSYESFQGYSLFKRKIIWKPYQFDIKGSSDESESDDDEEPDPSSRREPNKFDNLCDGVTNTMAYVHGAMQEVGALFLSLSLSLLLSLSCSLLLFLITL